MNAVTNNSHCSCELCLPNWHLGDNGDFVPLTEVEKTEQAQKQDGEAAESIPAAPAAFAA